MFRLRTERNPGANPTAGGIQMGPGQRDQEPEP